ncbi:MAG: hypothetical protein KKH79_08830 [Candidatus Thermoplasmatota archaeon]|nr:hypothetical protein [Candidatus Thermoplasmatota archaeon]MBU4145028.1 hypothetical protein [Candidatus Thermoplasmatota archaeon]
MLLLVFTATQPAMSHSDFDNPLTENSQIDNANPVENYTTPVGPVISGQCNDESFQKKDMSKVIVATNDINELAFFLIDYDYNGLVGDSSTISRGIAFPILEVPTYILADIEKLPSVLGIYDYEEPINEKFDDQEVVVSKIQSLMPDASIENEIDYQGPTYYHGAEKAWENGFTGKGINVATISQGTDLGHFELAGRHAIDENISSPYFNYPIAFDDSSMISYLTNGLERGTNSPTNSWYVNSSSTDLHVYHTPIIDGVNDFWSERNLHGLSESIYPISQTNEFRSLDAGSDISWGELDLTSLYVTSDENYWYFGFNICSLPRAYNVSYGMYIDTNGVPNSGGLTDPLGNYINTSTLYKPEYAVYMKHIGIDWGFIGPGVVWSNNNTLDNATYEPVPESHSIL